MSSDRDITGEEVRDAIRLLLDLFKAGGPEACEAFLAGRKEDCIGHIVLKQLKERTT